MKSMILVALALVAVAAAAPADFPQIVRSSFDSNPEGSYSYGYETENGIKHDEQGEVKQIVDDEKVPHNVVVMRGSYSYVNPDGKLETINYYADEFGFHPEGDSIPKNRR